MHVAQAAQDPMQDPGQESLTNGNFAGENIRWEPRNQSGTRSVEPSNKGTV